MAEGRELGFVLQLEQILQQAQHRWLRPVEICEILRNYRRFYIAPEPPNRPINGSLFLFDRKVLRYFRKDGHNWKKKKDGKTVKEAHEKLKAGSIDVLHCYYAHGEDNENFQRRCYWMLEEALMNIVLVHYREVKGSKTITNADSPGPSNFSASQNPSHSQAADIESSFSTHLSEYEDTGSDAFQPSSRYHSVLELPKYGAGMNVNLANACDTAPVKTKPFAQVGMERLLNESDGGLSLSGGQKYADMASWHEIWERCSTRVHSSNFDIIVSPVSASIIEDYCPEKIIVENILNGDLCDSKEDGKAVTEKTAWQFYIDEEGSKVEDIQNSVTNSIKELSELLLADDEGLKKHDSFSRWISNELGEVNDSEITLNSETYWNTLESENIIVESSFSNQEKFNAYQMRPSLFYDQLFSIIDLSPNCAYTDLEAKVLVKGNFLINKEDVQKYNWSCMFGEFEVPADVLAYGILSCMTPSHKPGRVPFYVTCSNRVSCSEIREFEFKLNDTPENTDSNSSCNTYDTDLLFRLEKLLVLEHDDYSSLDCGDNSVKSHTSCSICSMLKEVDDELLKLINYAPNEATTNITVKNRLYEESLKEKLHVWLLHKVGEDGKGPNVLNDGGLGVLHLAAALGFDWAIKPIIAAGVSINFRDVHGWTALHWAAFLGRERTIVTLIALEASPGALTDPTPEFPSGQTPADLASQNGYKGIAGFLAESSLMNHLRELTLKDSRDFDLTESAGLMDYHHSSEKGSSPASSRGTQTSLSDTLSAVRNATKAAARIYQVFRMQSFHRKKFMEYSNENQTSDENALSLIYVKSYKSRQHDMPVHTAAIKIQNKFRGWKGRKEFLSIRQQIVKIQAHVRGHQVRKHYRKILWSVGIVEKIILRWRRKGSGLRGFRSEVPIESESSKVQNIKDDDYAFLQDGRKQTEARLEKALARVKSMVQYPEARDQYRRLLKVVEELQESNYMQVETPNEMMEAANDDLMLELQGLVED